MVSTARAGPASNRYVLTSLTTKINASAPRDAVLNFLCSNGHLLLEDLSSPLLAMVQSSKICFVSGLLYYI